jgi:receptor expression-enhancing protein 5/6
MQINEHLKKVPMLEETAKKLDVPKIYLVGGFFLILLIMIFNNLGQFLTYLVGFVYPSYMSLLALESSKVTDDTQWLTYWVVFAVMNAFDRLLTWIPQYYLLKLVVLGYLIAPQTRGSDKLYQLYVRPYFQKKEKDIDAAVKVIFELNPDHQ